jgi:protein-L-isoaspartate O-methyltransferase
LNERHYSEEVCYGLAGGNAELVKQAFQEVRKENFLFAPPWTTINSLPGRQDGRMVTSNIRDLYHDVLVALLPQEHINTGQPSLWAHILHWSELKAGMRVFQSGARLGYYTAILAHMAGPNGRVFYEEPHELLTRTCADNLAAYGNVTNDYRGELLDRVYLFYGTTTISARLLEGLAMEGRAILPLTDHEGRGRFVSMTKNPMGLLAEAGFHCSFIKSKDYKPNTEIGTISMLERVFVDRISLKRATEGGDIDLVRAIIAAMERA